MYHMIRLLFPMEKPALIIITGIKEITCIIIWKLMVTNIHITLVIGIINSNLKGRDGYEKI